MNKANMESVAHIVENSKRFDMRDYFIVSHDRFGGTIEKFIDNDGNFCGTACCIAGEAALASGKKKGGAHSVARDYMELTEDQAWWLFYGGWSEKGTGETDNKRAARAIRKLIYEPEFYRYYRGIVE